ncbi:hypothetical protein SFHH103_psfHH103d_387 (plasmid) [Sinorhizobium fredii HH103]|nr:hypothetical protein SFHH103_psfHH103d_387 [Sinorhizobium fredii HH103]
MLRIGRKWLERGMRGVRSGRASPSGRPQPAAKLLDPEPTVQLRAQGWRVAPSALEACRQLR